MSDTEDLTPEERFAVHINKAITLAVKNDADADQLARICLNTARELYDHYGAGEEHSNFQTFVVDAGFEAAEIEAFLAEVEGLEWREGDE